MQEEVRAVQVAARGFWQPLLPHLCSNGKSRGGGCALPAFLRGVRVGGGDGDACCLYGREPCAASTVREAKVGGDAGHLPHSSCPMQCVAQEPLQSYKLLCSLMPGCLSLCWKGSVSINQITTFIH